MKNIQRSIKQLPKRTVQRGIAASLIFWIPFVGFLGLAQEVLEKDTPYIDAYTLLAINSFASPTLDIIAVVLTNFGGFLAITVYTGALVLVLLGRHRPRAAIFSGLSLASLAIINVLLKNIFDRTRPELWQRLVEEPSFSFPSGHAMLSAGMAATLIAISWNGRYRWWVLGVGLIFALIIGLTRLYLGVHYPTDIIGGWLVSILWVSLLYRIIFRRPSSS